MSPEQRKYFYFPKLWAPLARAMDWRMEGGRLVANLDEQLAIAVNFPPEAQQLLQELIAAAQGIAAGEHRATTSEDLRHACNLVASAGKTGSSDRLSQRNLNHFERMRNLLLNPWDDMNAMIAWLNPAEDDRQRSVVYLRTQADEARLRAISVNAWQTRDWETLDQAQLDALMAEVKRGAWKRHGRSATAGHKWKRQHQHV
jgi:hypothetical protein